MNQSENTFNDVRTYLPKYLSEEDTKKLFEELKSFPNNMDSRFYSNIYFEEDYIAQGNGLNNFIVVNLPDKRFYSSPVMVFSNTCDISNNNIRRFAANICYAPIFSLSSYKEQLLTNNIKDIKSTENHLEDIRKQRITQILYLPKGGKLKEECIVFLDRINHCSINSINSEEINSQKLFMLSNYGFYLFLIKLSIHFTRLQENVNRK